MAYVLFAFTAPWSVVVGWGWILLLFCAGAVKNLRWEPTAVLTAEFRDWPQRFWHYSTTVGRAIAYQPAHRAPPGQPWTSIQHHEHVHVRQVEDAMLLSFIVGLVVGLITWNPWIGLGLWVSGGTWQMPNYLTAMLRGGNAYNDAQHELSAYAQTDTGSDGTSWLDHRTSQKP